MDTAAEVFNEPVRPEDSISDLGVDSFLIIALCQRLEERLGIDIDVQKLINADCLGTFAQSLPTTPDAVP
jgi:acyl carrier protein